MAGQGAVAEEEAKPLLAQQEEQAPGQQGQQQQRLEEARHAAPEKVDDEAAPPPPAAPLAPAGKAMGQCRICLEEDALDALVQPCACDGTQRHVHRSCLQTWINESCSPSCEVCGAPYAPALRLKVPAPRQPDLGEPLSLPLGAGVFLLEDQRAANRLLQEAFEADWDEQRQPAPVSWCFSLMLFLLLLLTLQGMGPSTAMQQGAGGEPGAPAGPAGSGPSADPAGAGGPAAYPSLVAGASLLAVWLLSKLFLLVLPMLIILRLAARGQERLAEAAAAEAASLPGHDGPAAMPGAPPAAGSPRPGRSARQALRLLAPLPGSPRAGTGRSRAPPAAGGAGADADAEAGRQLAALELDVEAVRRAALSRLGRDPSFWGSAAAAAAAAGAARAPPSPTAPGAAQAEEARVLGAIRAAIRQALLQRELGPLAAASGSSSGSNSTSSSAAAGTLPGASPDSAGSARQEADRSRLSGVV